MGEIAQCEIQINETDEKYNQVKSEVATLEYEVEDEVRYFSFSASLPLIENTLVRRTGTTVLAT